MPLARQLNSVQSDDHGVLLWAPIDDGRTRIGFVFNQELQAKYGEAGVVAEEVAIAEAKKAAAPFTLDFIKVDWVTRVLFHGSLARLPRLRRYSCSIRHQSAHGDDVQVRPSDSRRRLGAYA